MKVIIIIIASTYDHEIWVQNANNHVTFYDASKVGETQDEIKISLILYVKEHNAKHLIKNYFQVEYGFKLAPL